MCVCQIIFVFVFVFVVKKRYQGWPFSTANLFDSSDNSASHRELDILSPNFKVCVMPAQALCSMCVSIQAGTCCGESLEPDLIQNFILKIRMLTFSRDKMPQIKFIDAKKPKVTL